MSGVPFDDQARAALKAVQETLKGTRDSIVVFTQFQPGSQMSPSHPNWGKPNPVDISGIIESVFVAGIRYANSYNEARTKG